ncbi:sulfur metabolite repression control protein-like protein SconB [Bipolaris maydis]|nr:quinon protein alcohol dehydrogenase-like superfamily [Bipolaris maydis]KAJ6196153.1 sulfur metabolite repression control protein-like protein SconB [Bipolaris maydis]KAJ6208248.1 sulfur metabolite repression control protein-like protein SconB [Bipolaris maydis]KAJ6270239.1 quinon protein alcohol dehydrogenase-like superfamily [Bipolaris maydis]KAJ6283864.1 quinon protein alcohol dehydrogenase-like superfamily [Bipolaris maydis]
MAPNATHTIETVAEHTPLQPSTTSPKQRRLSWRNPAHSPDDFSAKPSALPHAALMHGHDHEGLSERTRHLHANPEDSEEAQANKSKKIEKMITPYLAQHIPHQYNPLGATGGRQDERPPTANTKFCYRHRPDLLCRRQADEPSMEQLQDELGRESQGDQQSIANVWSLFSAAPSRHRNLMLQGILAQCCFPQLSFISSSVRNLIKIDFLGALPTELGFKILCYLDTTSLCKAAQVNRRWRQLADDDVVWHRMCEQHIDRKCTKCGWGLPLLDQRRLRQEKRRIQLRASGRGLNEWSPNITPQPDSLAPPTSLSHQLSDVPGSPTAVKRSVPDDSSSPEASSKRKCLNAAPDQDQLTSSFDHPKKRPWKDIYKDRYKVGSNWKYGRYSTRILKGHTNGVMCLQFDDEVLITGSYDATVKVWDLKTGQVIRTLTGHSQGIRSLQFEDSKLITGSLDNTIKIWNWRTGALIKTLNAHSQGVIGLHMAGKLLASGSSDNTIVVHDFTQMKRTTLVGHTDWVNSVKIDLPSRTLLSASDDMTVKLWDLDTHRCIRTYEGHVGQVQQVLPLPLAFEIDENDFIANANNDSSDTASLSSDMPHSLPLPLPSSSSNTSSSSQTPADDSLFFPDDPTRPAPPSYMLTGSLDGTIRLWHVPSGRCVHRFFGHVEGIWSLAADSLRLVSGAEDKTIKIWDPRTGKHERTLTGHTGPITCVGLSDESVVSGSEDGTVRVHCFVGDQACV